MHLKLKLSISIDSVLLIGNQLMFLLLQKQHLSPILAVHEIQNIVFLQMLHYLGLLSDVRTEKQIPQLIISMKLFQLADWASVPSR